LIYYYSRDDSLDKHSVKYSSDEAAPSGGIFRSNGVRVFTEIYEDDYYSQYHTWKQMQDELMKPYKEEFRCRIK
jgi:hypothetical protein